MKKGSICLLRVIAMVSVVLGHTAMYGSNIMIQLYKIIYLYHIPLFVFISGFCLNITISRGGQNQTYHRFVFSKFRRLIIPTIIAAVIIIMPTELFVTKSISYSEISQRIMGLLKGNVAHLWYLNMLFWLFVIYYPIAVFARKSKNRFIVCNIVCCCVGVFVFLRSKIIWEINFYSINQTARYFIFFELGYICSAFHEKIEQYVKKYGIKILMIQSIVVINIIQYIICNWDTYIGAWFIVDHLKEFLFCSIVVIGYLYVVTIWINQKKDVSKNLIIKTLDKCSMGIYLIHILIGEIVIKVVLRINEFISITQFNKIQISFFMTIVISTFLVYFFQTVKDSSRKNKK